MTVKQIHLEQSKHCKCDIANINYSCFLSFRLLIEQDDLSQKQKTDDRGQVAANNKPYGNNGIAKHNLISVRLFKRSQTIIQFTVI